MTALKSLTIVGVLLVGGTSLAVAQNGPATGNEPPVAGGRSGSPVLNYFGAHAIAPGYVAQLGYAAPRSVATPRNLYMSARGNHHKRLETGQPPLKQPGQAQ